MQEALRLCSNDLGYLAFAVAFNTKCICSVDWVETVMHVIFLVFNLVKVVFGCHIIAMMKFVGTALAGLVVLCTCKDKSEYPIMLQCSKMSALATNYHKETVNRWTNLIFAGLVGLQKSLRVPFLIEEQNSNF